MKLTSSGSGWHFESMRHSNARKFGHAGGSYAIHKKPFVIEVGGGLRPSKAATINIDDLSDIYVLERTDKRGSSYK